jgi:hypothetical protein
VQQESVVAKSAFVRHSTTKLFDFKKNPQARFGNAFEGEKFPSFREIQFESLSPAKLRVSVDIFPVKRFEFLRALKVFFSSLNHGVGKYVACVTSRY